MRCALLFLSLAALSAAAVPALEEIFPGIPRYPLKSGQYRLRQGKNPHQLSLMTFDNIKGWQTFLIPFEKKDGEIQDMERTLEIMSYLQELMDWGAQGPPTGFTIGASRIPQLLPAPIPQPPAGRKKRAVFNKRALKRRSIDNITAEDVGYAILALAQKTVKAQEKALQNSTAFKEAYKAIRELLESEKAAKSKREAVTVPKSVKEWLDLGLQLVKRMKEEGIVDAMEHTAKELAEAYEEQKHKGEKEFIERSKQSNFAEFVFDRDAEKKFDQLAGEMIRMEKAEEALPTPKEQRQKRMAPYVTLHGTYRLVPKEWSKEDMEVAYTALLREERKKRDLKMFREFSDKLGL